MYWGTKELPTGFELVDANTVENTNDFIENLIMELEYVKPDFMLFKDNLYIKTKNAPGRPANRT